MKELKHVIILFFILLLTNSLYGQETILYGVVYDEHGEPLIGATISLYEGAIQTTSDVNGSFIFTIDSYKTPTIIEASFVGYERESLLLEDTIKNPIILNLNREYSLDDQI